MLNRNYFEYGLSQNKLTDSIISNLSKKNLKDSRMLITLNNARFAKLKFDRNEVFCEYCDRDRKTPLVFNTFKLYENDLERYESNKEEYFYDSCSSNNSKTLTIDHINPIGKGGSITDINNMVVCCNSCNTRKGSKTFKEFYQQNMIGNPKYIQFIEDLATSNDMDIFVDALEFKIKNKLIKTKVVLPHKDFVIGFKEYEPFTLSVHSLKKRNIKFLKELLVFLEETKPRLYSKENLKKIKRILKSKEKGLKQQTNNQIVTI